MQSSNSVKSARTGASRFVSPSSIFSVSENKEIKQTPPYELSGVIKMTFDDDVSVKPTIPQLVCGKVVNRTLYCVVAEPVQIRKKLYFEVVKSKVVVKTQGKLF